MFKFSLRLCIWLALLVGSVLGLVLDREPWVRENKKYTKVELEAAWPGIFSEPAFLRLCSPDETRDVYDYNDYESSYKRQSVIDLTDYQRLCSIAKSGNERIFFLDNETMVAIDYSRPTEASHSVLRRRFPEWWWGIFYRPLFWIAVAVFIGTVFEFVSRRKRLKTA